MRLGWDDRTAPGSGWEPAVVPGERPGGLDDHEAEMSSRLGTFLTRAEQALAAAKTAVLAAHGLSVAQYGVLAVLDFVPAASAAQLSRACGVSPQAMAHVVARLEKKGYVTRRPSALNVRVLGIALTEAGRVLARAADRDVKAVETQLESAFTPEESGRLRALLTQATETLEKETRSRSQQ